MDRKWIESIVSQAIDMCDNNELPHTPANVVEALFELGYIEAAQPTLAVDGDLPCFDCGGELSHYPNCQRPNSVAATKAQPVGQTPCIER